MAMEEKDMHFIAEVYHLIKKIEDLVNDNDMSHRVMAAIFVGVIDEADLEDIADSGESHGNVNMRSMYSFNIDSREEYDVMKSIMDEAYENQDPDLGGLLDGLGISLN
jgi:hypothetical protein